MRMASDGSTLSWTKVRDVTTELLASNTDSSWGEFKSAAAERLGVPVEALKRWKMEMKELIARGLDADGDGDDGEFDGDYEHNGARKGCGSDASAVVEEVGDAAPPVGPKRCNNDSSKDGDEESHAMKALKQMSKAMNLGPRPFKGLKKMAPGDAEKTLRERLFDAGGDFTGAFPSAMEIARAKRKTDKDKDLEGIDMGNVIHGSRRRGQPEIIQPSKRRRSADGCVPGESERFEGGSNGESGGEDSEVEFEL